MSDDTPVLIFRDPSVQDIPFSPPHHGDAGIDIASAEDIELPAGSQTIIKTGLHMAIPLGWVGLVRDRSSMAAKGISTHGGVIDASYRGEIGIVISNRSSELYLIRRGDRIAQLVVVPCLTSLRVVRSPEELGGTDRGHNGFGSSGR